MTIRQRLATDGHGRAVLVKEASGADAARLAAEAEVLRAATHPGVAELVEERRGEDGSVGVTLAVAGSRTAADVRTGVAGVAGLMAALAATVADLHDLGIVHGRVRAEHVVLDAAGRPVLCGFGAAGPADPTPGRRPADDVAGLGGLLRELLAGTGAVVAGSAGGVEGEWAPAPVRRFGRRDRRSAFVLRALLALAEQSTADDPTRRPSARRFADAIVATLPGARLPATKAPAREAQAPVPAPDRGPARRPDDGRRRSPWLPVVAGALGLGLLVFGIGGLLRPPPAPRSSPARAAAPPSSPPSTAPASPVPDPTSVASPPTDPATPGGSGDVVARVAGEGIVAVGTSRYAVGAPGDVLAVGDWDCDGAPTVAVLRPATGSVFVFDRWAEPGEPLTVPATAAVPGAVSLAAADAGGGCPTLVVTDGQGNATEVVT